MAVHLLLNVPQLQNIDSGSREHLQLTHKVGDRPSSSIYGVQDTPPPMAVCVCVTQIVNTALTVW